MLSGLFVQMDLARSLSLTGEGEEQKYDFQIFSFSLAEPWRIQACFKRLG